jgi:hypothetical protein
LRSKIYIIFVVCFACYIPLWLIVIECNLCMLKYMLKLELLYFFVSTPSWGFSFSLFWFKMEFLHNHITQLDTLHKTYCSKCMLIFHIQFFLQGFPLVCTLHTFMVQKHTCWPHCDLWEDGGKDMSFIKKTMEEYWFSCELETGILDWSDYVLLICLFVLVLFVYLF